MKKIIKENNGMFLKAICTVCLNYYDLGDYVYKLADSNGDVCDQCAHEDEKEIIERIKGKIVCLKKGLNDDICYLEKSIKTLQK